MFKKASDHDQSREFRKVAFSTKNDHGIDPRAFAEQHRQFRERLDGQIREIEFKLGAVQHHLGHSYFERHTETGRALHRKLLDERDQLNDQLAELRLQLAGANAERNGFLRRIKDEERRGRKQEQRQEREEAFERMFIHMAKKMLAGEVFDRILIATIHQIREEHDMSERGSRRLAEKIADVRIK
jgi:hypothetical protein